MPNLLTDRLFNPNNRNVRTGLVIFGGILIHLSLGTAYTFGNLNPYLTSYLRHHGYPDMEYSKSFWIIALSSALQGLGMSFGGVLQQKVGTRLAALFGCWIMSAGVILSYFTVQYSFIAICITYGVMFGFGFCIAYEIPLGCAVKWAPDRKGLFSGFIVAGFGGGSFIFNYIQTSYLNPHNKVARVEVNGNKYFDQEDILQRVPTLFLILGGTYFIMQFIGCMLLFQPPSTTPSTQEEDCRAMIESEVNEDGQAKTDVNVIAKTPSTPSTPIPPENILDPPIEVHPVQIIKTRAFWTLAVIFLFNGLGVIIVSAMFKAYGQTFIKDDYFLTLVASVSALFNASGRLLWGYIGDKYSFKLGMSLLSGLFCILVLLLTVTSIAGKYFFLIWICLIFLTFSGNYSLFPYAIAQTFGLRYCSINYGLLFTTQAVSGLVGAIITTLLYDTMGWSGLFFLVSGMTFISMLLAFSFNAKKPDGSDI